MKLKSESIDTQNEHDTTVDYQPLIELFELLLEWNIQDVQEEAEERKEIS